jgi:hypothetical protein
MSCLRETRGVKKVCGLYERREDERIKTSKLPSPECNFPCKCCKTSFVTVGGRWMGGEVGEMVATALKFEV